APQGVPVDAGQHRHGHPHPAPRPRAGLCRLNARGHGAVHAGAGQHRPAAMDAVPPGGAARVPGRGHRHLAHEVDGAAGPPKRRGGAAGPGAHRAALPRPLLSVPGLSRAGLPLQARACALSHHYRQAAPLRGVGGVGKADYRLYVILDDGRRRSDPAAAALAAIQGGATMVQWSSGAQSTRVQIEAGRRLAEVTRSHGVPLVIGGRLDVMLAIGADGVLLGPQDMPADLARRLAGRETIIGVLSHDPAEAKAAAEQGADYVLYAGPAEAVAGQVAIPVIA